MDGQDGIDYPHGSESDNDIEMGSPQNNIDGNDGEGEEMRAFSSTLDLRASSSSIDLLRISSASINSDMVGCFLMFCSTFLTVSLFLNF